MRPDKSCVHCSLSHKKEKQWKCKIIDKFTEYSKKKMKRKGVAIWLQQKVKEIIGVEEVPFIKWFWYACITLKNLNLSEGCIKCGDCCKGYEYQVAGLFIDKNDPKTGYPSYMCKHLEYHSDLDNGRNDLGWRCSFYGKTERPQICRDFPTGHEDVTLEVWLDEFPELKNTSLPKCPARFKILTEGIS